MIVWLVVQIIGVLFAGAESILQPLFNNMDLNILNVFGYLAQIIERGVGVVVWLVGEDWWQVFIGWLLMLIDIDSVLFVWRMIKMYII